MAKLFSFTKQERLKSKKQIDTLFQTGKAFFYFPFHVKYTIELNVEQAGIHFGVSIPKRYFKKAILRNRLKRQSRESFRLQKNNLKTKLTEQGKLLSIMFIYSHQQLCNYEGINIAMSECLKKIYDEIQAN